jgi:hypothetical protein
MPGQTRYEHTKKNEVGPVPSFLAPPNVDATTVSEPRERAQQPGDEQNAGLRLEWGFFLLRVVASAEVLEYEECTVLDKRTHVHHRNHTLWQIEILLDFFWI